MWWSPDCNPLSFLVLFSACAHLRVDVDMTRQRASACAAKPSSICWAVQANWDAYAAEEVQELPHGHLVPYPIAVEPDGFVTTLPGHRNFPDTKGSILGAVMKVRAQECLKPKCLLTLVVWVRIIPDHAAYLWFVCRCQSSCGTLLGTT